MESLLTCLERWPHEATDIPGDLWVPIVSVCEAGCVPALQLSEDRPYEPADFDGVAEKTLATLRTILAVTDRLVKHKHTHGSDGSTSAMKSFVAHVLLLCGEHIADEPWTSAESRQLSAKVQTLLCPLVSCATLSEVLTSDRGTRGPVFKLALKMQRPKLLQNTWKRYPAARFCYQWILYKVKHPHLGAHLVDMLPTALIITDDYELKNKVFGVQCLQHIIENTNPTELRWHQQAEVVYDALEHLLYTRDPDLVMVLHPCLLRALQVLETADQPHKLTRYDKVLQLLLQDMEVEQRLDLQRAYVQQLPPLVEAMGIAVARWLQQLIRVTGTYLQADSQHEDTTRKYSLLVLKTAMCHAWPCVPHHCQSLLETLLRLLYDLTCMGESTALETGSDQGKLLQLLVECLALVQMAAPEKVRELCRGLHGTRLNDRFLHTVCTTLHRDLAAGCW